MAGTKIGYDLGYEKSGQQIISKTADCARIDSGMTHHHQCAQSVRIGSRKSPRVHRIVNIPTMKLTINNIRPPLAAPSVVAENTPPLAHIGGGIKSGRDSSSMGELIRGIPL